MRMILAPCLIAGLALPAGAEADNRLLVVAPFEILENRPDCTGPGKVPFQVAFDLKDAKARFGLVDQKAARTCSIRTRRGSEVQEISIPCPDATEDPSSSAGLDGFPTSVSLSGRIIACMEIGGIAVLDGSWALSASSPMGPVDTRGDLTTSGVAAVLDGPISAPKETDSTIRPQSAKLTILWDAVDTELVTKTGASIRATSYVVLVPSPEQRKTCWTAGCKSSDFEAGWMLRNYGGRQAYDVFGFVEGK